MAKQLARDCGFNICIVARNQAKMDQKLAEIKKMNPKIETKAIVADFSKMNTIAHYKETIAEKLVGMDIALLILNAGWGGPMLFEALTIDEVEATVNINALHVIYTARVVMPMLLSRHSKTGVKSGIFVTSSILGDVPFSGCLTYSAAKAFAKTFAEALSVELKDRVDVLTYHCGFVKTKLSCEGVKASRGMDEPPSIITCTTEQTVANCFRDFGIESATYGHLKHGISASLMCNLLPLSLIQWRNT